MGHLRSLNPFFLRYKWHFAGGLLFVLLSTVFKIYQAVIVRDGSEKILQLLREPGTASNSRLFLEYAGILIGSALLSGFFLFMMRQTIIVMSRHIEYDQKNGLYQHYQELDAGFYKRHTTGDLMNRISEDVSRVRMYTGPAVMYLSNTVVTSVTVLIFMMSVNARLTLMVFLPLPVLSVIIYFVSDRINRQGTRVQEELGHLTTQAQESFSAIRVIKAYARESFFINEMKERSAVYRKTALKLANIEALFAPTMFLMVGASVLITIWYGGRMAVAGEIRPGNIPEFILYVFYMTWPFASLGWVTSLIQRASASQARINEFLNLRPVVFNTNNAIYLVKGSIEFRNVSFVYPENGVRALHNISFKLKSGQTLGITGPVGSGKSSILTLLTRQYDASSGEILIDDLALPQHNLSMLRKLTGVVPQEIFLFSDTIANNIAFGKHGLKADLDELKAAATKAGVYENITSFPDQFETVVGERGVTLSGGQKQRISIARALIGNPQLLLLDDCLSAVDTETEEEILHHLRSELRDKTSVIISHRISAIRAADLILYMKDGSISEMGSHEELMALKKDYFRLYELQNN